MMKKLLAALLLLCSVGHASAQQLQLQFGAYVGGLPPASLPLTGSEYIYIRQAGVSKNAQITTAFPWYAGNFPGNITVAGTAAIGGATVAGGYQAQIDGRLLITGNNLFGGVTLKTLSSTSYKSPIVWDGLFELGNDILQNKGQTFYLYDAVNTIQSFIYNLNGAGDFVFPAGGVSVGSTTTPPTNGLYVAGDAGIGASSPVHNSGYTTVTLNNATNGGVIELQSAGVNAAQIFNNSGGLFINTITSLPIILRTNAGVERMRVDNVNGGVGFGSSSFVASTGEIVMAKISDPNTSPGVGNLKLTVEAGTNSGSCKIVARAGTSATPVTLLDNVGSGC